MERKEHAPPRSTCFTNNVSPNRNEKTRSQSSGTIGSEPDDSMAPKRESDSEKFSARL